MQKTVTASINDSRWGVPVGKQSYSARSGKGGPAHLAAWTIFTGISGVGLVRLRLQFRKCAQALSDVDAASVLDKTRVEGILTAFPPKPISQLGKLSQRVSGNFSFILNPECIKY